MTERALDWSTRWMEAGLPALPETPRCIVVHSPAAPNVTAWYADRPLAATTPHLIIDQRGLVLDSLVSPLQPHSVYASIAPLGLVLLRDAPAHLSSAMQRSVAACLIARWWAELGFVPLLAQWQVLPGAAAVRMDWPEFHSLLHREVRLRDPDGQIQARWSTYMHSPAQEQDTLVQWLQAEGVQ